jgi:hypothetical protein
MAWKYAVEVAVCAKLRGGRLMSVPSLDQVIKQVIAACLAGGESAAKMKTLIEGVMMTPMAPPSIQALGDGLVRVLEGKRGEEATAGLPDDVAELVRTVLQAIGAPSSNGA